MKPREPNLSDRYQRPYGMPRPAPTEPVGAFDRAAATKPRRQRKGAGSRPNAAVETEYRRRLEMLVLSMHTSVLYWMTAAYRQNPPIMAMDGTNSPCPPYAGHAMPYRTEPHRIAQDESEVMPSGLRPTQRNSSTPTETRPPGATGAAPAELLLKVARRLDRMGYSLGLRDVRIVPDRSKWHSYYDFAKDRIVTEGKFWRAPAAERLHMMIHEIGHRGQDADRAGYEAFKRMHENKLSSFEAMANRTHLRDERAGHLHDLAEEVWAESYARWCLGLPMPAELKGFWDAREHSGYPDDGAHAAGGAVDGVHGRMAADALGAGTTGRMGLPLEGAEPHHGAHFDGTAAEMAFDRTPADYLRAAFARLRKRWEERFDDAALKLARWFAQSAATRSDERLRRILKDGGLSVKFTPTKAMRDVMEGTVQANVALIKSIPEKYLTQVEGMVYRSVQTGRDLHQLSNDLRHELGVTKRRAATIALSQNNMATSAMTRARQMELGMQATWVHSHAGKVPRKTHLANDGQPYNPELGWFDPDPKVRKRIWPGQLPGCRCFSRTTIPGFKS